MPLRHRPAISVLDVDCKAHELDNLYVVDTSFFPSIGAVNPALTAMANGCASAIICSSGSGQAESHMGPPVRLSRPARGAASVVILGGGFGGLAAARGCAAATSLVTLVDRTNHHLFQPLLYQAASRRALGGRLRRPDPHPYC